MPCGVASRSATEFERLPGAPILETQPGHDAYALRLDEDPTLGAFLRTDRVPKAVVSAPEPLAVPARRADRLPHRSSVACEALRLPGLTQAGGNGGHLIRGQHEQPGDKDALGDPAVPVGGGLERLTRRIRKAVQVQAVIPVGAPDQRQAVRADPLERVLDRALQMPVQAFLRAGPVVIGNRRLQDAPIAGLFEIGRGS